MSNTDPGLRARTRTLIEDALRIKEYPLEMQEGCMALIIERAITVGHQDCIARLRANGCLVAPSPAPATPTANVVPFGAAMNARIAALTEADRDVLDEKGEHKALRIIDALTARVADLEREQAEERRLHCTARLKLTQAKGLEYAEAYTAANARANAANALLERAATRLDRVNFPEWWKDYDAHLTATETE